MIQVKQIANPKKLNDALTNSFRELVEQKLGKIDTADSFMYLFRRFGIPNYDHKNDYKILYEYMFRHKDLYITIHASYHDCVYFNLFVSQRYFGKFIKERRSTLKRLVKQSLYRNIPFMPYSLIFFEKYAYFTKRQSKKNWYLIDRAAQKYFSKEDYVYVEAQSNSKEPDKKMFDMLMPFGEYLCKEFRKTLSHADVKALNRYWPTINDITEIKKQALSFIRDLKKGVYVRDCEINIKGYATEENKIHFYVNE
jgi:hypothetical protein